MRILENRAYEAMDGLLFVLVGVALGGLFSAALALPWLDPLPDYVVNAWTNMCTAVLAVGGAFLLWRRQIREREKVLTRTLVLMFESFMKELNLVRISLDYDHVIALMQTIKGSADPKDVPINSCSELSTGRQSTLTT